MTPMHASAVVLMIAFALIAAAPVHARCAASQDSEACRPALLAQYRLPFELSPLPVPKPACKPFAPNQDVRNAGAWSTLDIVPLDAPVPLAAAQAELQRVGGARLVLEIGAKALRQELLEQSRHDIRRLLREARIAALFSFSDDTIEVQPRDVADLPRILHLIDTLTSGPFPQLEVRRVDRESAARVTLAVADRAIVERRQISEQTSADIIKRRLEQLGIENSAVQALGAGRILVITPGLKYPTDFMHPLLSTSKLTLQIADGLADPCATTQPPADFEILNHHATGAFLLAHRSVLAGGQDLAAVAVALDAQTRAPTVAARFSASAAGRLHKATRDSPGQLLAVVLDSEVIAAPIIREPIAHGAIRISGGLTLDQAKHLALLLRAGALPSRMTVVEWENVAPGIAKP